MTEEQKTEGCSESACSSCSQAGSCSSKKVDLHEPANAHSSIGKVIGVVSGKGGVGKSLVTGSLARQMVKMGYKVGILDADITGPSIPKMYGIHEKAQGTQEGILPRIAKDGTKIMSVNLLLEDEEAPVIWRGPVIAGVVKQFWTENITIIFNNAKHRNIHLLCHTIRLFHDHFDQILRRCHDHDPIDRK